MKTRLNLLSRYMHTARPGTVEWIGLRTLKKGAIAEPEQVQLIAGRGAEGDHRCASKSDSARQLTLINLEDIQALTSLLGREHINPALLRRNVVVSGINLHAMRYQRLQIGEAVVELGAHCHPCQRMEKALGEGAFLAMYNRGGYCATVVESGLLSVGDPVTLLPKRE